MKQKKKLGRKLLGFLLTLTILVGLMPGMGLTVYAADVPYASLKNTTSVIIFDNKQWYLIDYDDSTVTLLSKECVGASVFNPNEPDDNTYSGSTVENFVNSWYTRNISPDAQAVVSGSGMFLLTEEQAVNLSTDVLKCSRASGAYDNHWWLCSKGTTNSSAAMVNGESGKVSGYSGNVWIAYGVRPALKLNLESVIFSSESNTLSKKVNVSGVSLNKEEVTLKIDGTESLTATVSPADDTDKTVSWTSSDTTVATVDTAGKVTAVGAGTAVITATATNGTTATDDDKSAACTVTVEKSASAITKVPTANTLTYNGKAQELVTKGEAADGEMQYALGTKDAATGEYSASIPTGTEAGTYYVWYKVVGDDNHTDTEPMSLKVTIANKGDTEIKTEVKKDDKSPEIKTSNLTDEFAESTLSNEEKAAIEEAINNGEDVKVDVYLEIEDISDAISASDKEKIEASATNADNIAFFDISLFKEISISGQSQGAASIHNLTTPLKLTIGVPKSFPAVADGYTRTYVVLRLHDGSVTVLPTTLNADGTLSFETDKFSTYALAYTDVKKEETKEPTADTPTTTVDTPTTKVDTPTANADTSKAEVKNTDNKISTGDKMNIGIIIMLMVDSAMAALYLTLRKKMIK